MYLEIVIPAPVFMGLNYGRNPLWTKRWIPAFAGMTPE